MQNSRNPVLFLRKLHVSLRGLRRAEEWRVYCGVALLAGALSGLLLLQAAALHGEMRAASVLGQKHVELRVEIPRVEPVERASERQDEVREATQAPAQTAVRGEWYYSETHRDWRYRKIP